MISRESPVKRSTPYTRPYACLYVCVHMRMPARPYAHTIVARSTYMSTHVFSYIDVYGYICLQISAYFIVRTRHRPGVLCTCLWPYPIAAYVTADPVHDIVRQRPARAGVGMWAAPEGGCVRTNQRNRSERSTIEGSPACRQSHPGEVGLASSRLTSIVCGYTKLPVGVTGFL